MGVRLLAEAQVRDGVALEAVGAALEDDELGLVLLEVRLDALPGFEELVVARPWHERDVELGAACRTRAGLRGGARARVQEAPVLVQVGENERRIVLEAVVDPVAVVGVDVDVGDARQPVVALERLGDNAAVVEHAEAGRVAAGGMVQPGDGHERALHVAAHQRFGGHERRADHGGGRLEDAGHRRRVAGIEVALTCPRSRPHQFDVGRGVKPADFLHRGLARLERNHRVEQAVGLDLPHEYAVPVRAEGMPLAESVARDLLAVHERRALAARTQIRLLSPVSRA